jgi:hypothetical protein
MVKATVSTMAGASLLMSTPSINIDAAFLLRFFRAMERPTVNYYPKQLEDQDLLPHINRIITQRFGIAKVVTWEWEKWSAITPDMPRDWLPLSYMDIDLLRPPVGGEFRRMPEENLVLISFNDKDKYPNKRPLGAFPTDDPAKVAILVDYWRTAVGMFQPEWAVIDHMPNIRKRGTALRQYAWGVSIYGPELVEKIGREKLLKTPAYKVEELPWGGVWVQVAENPFTAPAETKRAVEKYLELKKVFA